MAALPFGSANKQAPILRYPPRPVRYSVEGEHRRQMVLSWVARQRCACTSRIRLEPQRTTSPDAKVALGATRPMQPRPRSAPKSRKVRRSRTSVWDGSPASTTVPRSPDFKGVNAGRPRKDFLSQHPAARSARTLAWKPSGAFRWEVKPLRLSTCRHPADQR